MKRVINLGHTRVVADQAMAMSAPIVGPSKSTVEITTISPSEALRLPGFPILMPKWLPSPEFQLVRAQKAVTLASPGSIFFTVLAYTAEQGHWIAVTQHPSMPSLSVPADGVEGRIGDRPAAFFNRTIPAKALPGGQLNVLQCLWEHGSYLMLVDAAGLSLGELVKVAESLS